MRNPHAQYKRNWGKISQSLKKGAAAHLYKGKSLEDCPVTTYDDYEEIIHQSVDKNTLTDEEIIFWGISTGTTGSPKLFPVSKNFLKSYKKGSRTFYYYTLQRHKKVLNGKQAIFVVPMNGEKHGSKPVAYLGQCMYQSLPKLADYSYAIPRSVYADENLYEEKHVRHLLDSDVSALLASVPSSIISLKPKIESFLVNRLEELSASTRYNYLKNINPHHFTLKDIWPNLALVLCWKTAVCKVSIPAVKEIVGDVKIENQFYAASEGFFNIYVDDTTPLLYPIDFIYEFLDESENKILKPWELEVNKEYELLITSPMGFVRYRIGDLVMCKSFHQQLPCIEFVRKAGDVLSLGWVTISENEIINVLAEQGVQDLDSVSVGLQEAHLGLSIAIHKKYISQIKDFDKKLSELNHGFQRELGEGRITPTKVVENNAISEIKKHAQTKDKVLVY